ncbi:ribonuclease H-like domain-containing protein [Tanacetum coccineum]
MEVRKFFLSALDLPPSECSLSPDLYLGQVYSQIASEVWDELQETYDKMDKSVIFNVINKIHALKQDELSVPEYYHKLNSLWREFDTLTLLHACTCAAYEGVLKHNQLVRLMQFLMGLNDAYLNIKSIILARDPLPDVKEAFNVVSKEESHMGNPSWNWGNLKMEMEMEIPSSGDVNAQRCDPSQDDVRLCLDDDLKKAQDHRNANANMASMRPTFFNGNVMFNLNFEKYFYAQTCSYMYNLTLGWIIDSGANQHLTNSTKNMFNVSDISSLNLTVGHPNGTLAKITAIGSLRLTANVVLFDVLVIPEYNASLMSKHKLIKDSKLFVDFDKTKCYIQDLNLVKTLGTGSEAAGLYLFDVEQCGKSVVGHANSTFVCHASKQLWHSRLGHPADHVLSVLSGKIGLKYDKHVSPCNICHKAKQTREPFPLSDHKSLAVGDLVHLYLWGPYRVVSRDGYIYFLTIVDDYSRAVWAYLLKTKDEVTFFIKSFVELIYTQFNKRIKVFRSDNGTEFVNNNLGFPLLSCLEHPLTC